MPGRDIKAGGAFVELLLKDKQFQRGLGRAKSGLGGFAKAAMKIAGPLAAAFSFGKTISAASDLEETMNKFNVVFGENATRVKAWGDGFAKEVGRSEEQIARFMAGAQDLFVPLGFEEGAAADMSKQITKLSLDLASFNNMQDADTMRDLQAALTGSGEVMKKYGVIVSEAAVKQELLNQGLDPKQASDQEKVMARMNIIMRGTTAAQGDAIRSSGGWANQLKALKGRVFDVAADIGKVFLPAMTKVIGFGVRFLDSIRSVIPAAIAKWQEFVDFVTPLIVAYRQALVAEFTAIWEVVKTVFNAVASIVSQVWQRVADVTGGAMGSFQDVVIGVLGAVTFAFENWRRLGTLALVSTALSVVRFANQIGYFFGTVVPTWLTFLWENWRDVFTDVMNFTKTVATNIGENLFELFEAIKRLFAGEGFSFNWTPLLDGFESAMKELPKIAAREMGPLEKSLQAEVDGIAAEIAADFDKHQKEFRKDIKGFAAGQNGPLADADVEAAAGGAEIAAAARGARNSRGDVFASFSAAALAAQGRGASKQTDRIVKAVKEQTKELLKGRPAEPRLAP